MNANDVLTLARAGFTAQQIAALATVNQQPAQPAPAASAQPVPAPAPAQPAPAAPAQPVPAPAPSDDVSAVLAKLGVLTEAIQSNGLLNANQPKQQTADEILAAIIQPPNNKE